MAKALKTMLAGGHLSLVINGDLDAAIAADMDGELVGKCDGSPAQERVLLGVDKILGLSCETPDTIAAANPAIMDHLDLGPVFETTNKTDHKEPVGFAGLAQLAATTSLPAVAFDGLKSEHQSQILASGADGRAVVRAICGQPDPKSAVEEVSHAEASQ